MARTKTIYVCQTCGSQYPKWLGQCRDCLSWNTLVEETLTASPRGGWPTSPNKASGLAAVLPLDQALRSDESGGPGTSARLKTGLNELDRVLGGGLVRGSYVLLGGDPGIGKSTLLLQTAGGVAEQGARVLYISAEESVQQTMLRARRLGVTDGRIHVASESRLETILQLARENRPDFLIIDSIQTIYLSELNSAPGSVSQVRECASHLMGFAKGEGIAVFLIGHVTKDGHLAGPRTLEHMVDTVLSFEGDANHQFRLLRALKNRFGPTNELGVFQMIEAGLSEVDNPSQLFLAERGKELIGSAIYAAMEGTRPLLCEVQALTMASPLAMPRRTSIGFDVNRVHLLVAVLDRHLDLELSRQDIFVNVVGGLKLEEPAADVAIAAALVSAAGRREIDPHLCFFGEIGLTGEVRGVAFAENRLREALKLGFTRFLLPESNRRHLGNLELPAKTEIRWIGQVKELAAFLEWAPDHAPARPPDATTLDGVSV